MPPDLSESLLQSIEITLAPAIKNALHGGLIYKKPSFAMPVLNAFSIFKNWESTKCKPIAM